MLKKFKKILSLILIWITIWELSFFAISNAKIWCWSATGFALYKCRVDDICKKYNDWPKQEIKVFENKDKEYDNSSSKISDSHWRQVYKAKRYLAPELYYEDEKLMKEYKLTPYAEMPVVLATKTYKQNMNWIYKCAILYSRRKALNEVEMLLKEETTGELAKKSQKRIEHNIKEINKLILYEPKQREKDLEFLWKCNRVAYENVSRRDILREVTYETCKMRMYMEFLKVDYYKKEIWNLVKQRPWEEKWSFQWNVFSDKYNKMLKKINITVSHSYNVFQRAYEEYTAYESNYMLHIFLVFLRDNFVVVRWKIHNVLTPMNQVAYKIANAMIQQ